MKAEPQLQWRLLDLQAADTRLAQIAHRTKNLPESAQVDACETRIREIDAQISRAQVDLDDVQRELDKAESDVTLVRERAARNQARLDAGQGSAKDLQALTHELESLARRQSELEETQLEVMERAEAAEARVASLTATREPLDADLAAARTAQQAAVGELDREKGDVTTQRGNIAAGVGSELLDLYEKIRISGGIGAAALRRRRCEGCNLELMAGDLERVVKAAADDVVRCEECRCILVRTAESGV